MESTDVLLASDVLAVMDAAVPAAPAAGSGDVTPERPRARASAGRAADSA
jgi:hypothetical protein